MLREDCERQPVHFGSTLIFNRSYHPLCTTFAFVLLFGATFRGLQRFTTTSHPYTDHI